MIDLTPLEVRKKQGDFRRAMRGYEPSLVDDFLELVADRMEELVRENMALAERLARQEQQVTDYRERERALTEALVTAQEMREEIRRQTVREADLSKRAAEQEVAQLRSSTEQEAAQLRQAAEQDAARLRQAAEQEVAQLRARVRQEVQQMREDARRDRERDEELLRRMRLQQRQFLGSYRAFLEQELAELDVFSRAAGQAAPVRAQTDEPGDEGFEDVEEGDTWLSPAVARAAGPDTGLTAISLVDADEPFEPEPYEPEDELEEEPKDEPKDEPGSAYGAEAEPPSLEVVAEPAGERGTWERASIFDTENVGGDLPAQANLYDGLASDVSGDGIPGPIGLGSIELRPLDGEGQAEAEAEAEVESPTDTETQTHTGAEAGGGAELDAAAEPQPGRLVASGWSAEDDQPDELELELLEPEIDALPEDEDEDEDDEETSLLLRNAAAAGYRLPDEDELLLEDEVEAEGGTEGGAADEGEDDGWLGSVLEDRR